MTGSEFVDETPKFQWQEVTKADEGIKKGLQGFDAIHFAGGSGAEHLGSDGCEDLSLQWGDRKNIVATKIGPNSLDEEAVQSLCQLLQKNDNILYFALYTNPLKKTCMQHLSYMLSINKTLVCLQLVDAKIKDESLVPLCEELELGNRTLLQLDLSSNLITDKGAKTFAKVLRVNDILTTISLMYNDIKGEGGAVLCSALDINYTVCHFFVKGNNITANQKKKIYTLTDRNVQALRESLQYCNEYVKEGPLRKAKICFVGKHQSGKTNLIEALKGQAFQENYIPTAGASVTQVLTRLQGEMWYGVSSMPRSDFGYLFLSRFINVKLDEKVDKIEAGKPQKKEVGFSAFKKKKNRRGSVAQRRGSAAGARKPLQPLGGGDNGRNSNMRASRMSAGRRSSVAMSILKSVMGNDVMERRPRGNSVSAIVLNAVKNRFNRAKNDLLDDSDYTFYKEDERAPGEAKEVYHLDELKTLFNVVVTAKARRERDNLSYNLLELSGNRAFYTVHHAFLTTHAVYVLVFDMPKLANKGDPNKRLEEIKYINYWLKVIKYHSPDARLMVVATRCTSVPRELYGSVESDISKLVFPELHKVHAKKKEQINLNKAVEAANEFAKDLEADTEGFIQKKTKLVINEKDRRLFFPVELTSGKGVDAVRGALDKSSQQQKYYGQKVPVRWLKFLDTLRRDSPSFFCTAERVEALAFQCLQNHKDEMKEALELFHELGYIVHVTEIEELKDTVITDTLSFYNIIFRLIFTDDLALFDMTEAREKFEDDINETLKTGVISKPLLDYLWEDERKTFGNLSEEDAKKGKQFFLEYAQLNLILSQYKFGETPKYVIPSMIPLNHAVPTETKEKFGEGMNLKCRFQFGGFLTLGVYERLLCLCLQFSTNQPNSLEPVLAMGWAQICFGMAYVFRIERMPDDIVLQVIEAKKKKKVYKLVESFEQMFGKLRQILGQGFKWTTKLEDADGNLHTFEEAKAKKLPGWFEPITAE